MSHLGGVCSCTMHQGHAMTAGPTKSSLIFQLPKETLSINDAASFFNPPLRICFYWFTERERLRESYQLPPICTSSRNQTCSLGMCAGWGLNQQLFWCMVSCSSQQSHPARAMVPLLSGTHFLAHSFICSLKSYVSAKCFYQERSGEQALPAGTHGFLHVLWCAMSCSISEAAPSTCTVSAHQCSLASKPVLLLAHWFSCVS